MSIFLFRAIEIKQDDEGVSYIFYDPSFEIRIEAQNNADAINIGIKEFINQEPDANVDEYVFGASLYA
ncbi:hypothetical protein [Candidatus Nitrotoga sp. AM1P]|uniref:hypothetical protein n=1 Tax=Candidatus Nitrotoga sp. AM1P TaxID=2559597 RepID=UPI0010B470E1|nr:hypothetical protein [Candidatus Nitrotoga sp. AM1P]BBJ24410.1 hypothetical protein W01_23370 [Candidatus Nitrotoga sp. AM1P]